MTDRTPPHSAEAEAAVLGSILQNPEVIHSVRGLVTPEDFYLDKNRIVFSSMLSIIESRRKIDAVSVGEWLQERHNLADLGGLAYLNTLMDGAVTTVHAPSHARRIKALSAQRGVLHAAQCIAAQAYQAQDNIEEFLGTAMTDIVAAASANTGQDPVHIGRGISRVAEIAMSGDSTIIREPTDIFEIDNKIYGLPKKSVTSLGARPSMGKSTVALNIAHGISKKGPVLYFSLEDPIQSQQSRIVSHLSGVPYFDLEGGRVPAEKHADITIATAKVKKTNIWFEERRLTADEICQKAIAFKAQRGMRLCVIDHLGYVARRGKEVFLPVYEYTSMHMRRFAFLAKELDCPVLLCVQLNRELERRSIEERRPRLSDMRNSGTIEEDSYQVIFVYRHCVYFESAPQNEMELLVAKNKNGPTGTIFTRCDIPCCRIGGAMVGGY